MAQSIDPFKKTPPPPPPPSPRQQELLARATGKKTAEKVPLPKPPQPAKGLPPGVTGTVPLPTGRVVSQVMSRSLTDAEREALVAVGYTDDIELPTTAQGLKELRDVIAQQQQVEVPLPVDPRTPPLHVDTVPIESLSHEQQARFAKAVRNIREAEKSRVAEEQQRAESELAEGRTQGLLSGMSAVDAAVAAFQRKVVGQKVDPNGVDASVADEPIVTAPSRSTTTQTIPQPQPEPTAPSETGANVPLSHCPHCEWDLAMPDIPESPHSDRMAFLHCLLGDRQFTKEYPLFAGKVSVQFRTLTVKELDIVYKQAYADQRAGKIDNQLDFFENVNRYRLILQLCSYRTGGEQGAVRDFPDGYSKSANPLATGFWVTPERESELTADETALPVIEEWIIENVLKSEAVFRVVNLACRQFNRLSAKMEAMADNSDFWSPTGEPS